MFSDAIVYCDENHCIASIGGAGHEGSFSRRQYRIAVDQKTGKFLRLANGGVVPKRRFRVVAKYTKEARGCYGVCCPVIDGKEQGQFIETFDYTETKLVSIKAYKKLMQQEMAYRCKMTSQGWKNFNGDNPYEEHYRESKLGSTIEECTSHEKVQVRSSNCMQYTLHYCTHRLTCILVRQQALKTSIWRKSFIRRFHSWAHLAHIPWPPHHLVGEGIPRLSQVPSVPHWRKPKKNLVWQADQDCWRREQFKSCEAVP